MTATSLVSFQVGWGPPARSMMLSRRNPSASPGDRASPARNPSSSGPRCSIAAVIARTREPASALREAKATPHMPHTLLFNLRRGEEGGAGTDGIRPQAEARHSQTAVRIPGKQDPQQQKENCRRRAKHEIEERFAFQDQAPVDRFIPARVNGVQEATQMQLFKRQTRQPYMSELVVRVLVPIVWDGPGGLGKQGRIPQLAACQRVAPRILHDNPVGWVDDDPAFVDQSLG